MTTTGERGKESLQGVIDALNTAIKKVTVAEPSFQQKKAKAFLEGIKSTITAFCSCQQNDGSYYEYPE